MKCFLKILAAVVAVFGAVIGALAIFDKIINKNRIKEDYLDCDTEDDLSDADYCVNDSQENE